MTTITSLVQRLRTEIGDLGNSFVWQTTAAIDGYLVRTNHGDTYDVSQGSFTAGGTMSFPTSSYQYATYYSDVEAVDAL